MASCQRRQMPGGDFCLLHPPFAAVLIRQFATASYVVREAENASYGLPTRMS